MGNLQTLGFRGEALFGCATMGSLAIHSGGLTVRYDEQGRATTDAPVASDSKALTHYGCARKPC